MDLDESETEEMMQPPEQDEARPPSSNENTSPEGHSPRNDDEINEEEIVETSHSFRWEQLVSKPPSPEDWIYCYSSRYPLRMLLSAALDACVAALVPDKSTIRTSS